MTKEEAQRGAVFAEPSLEQWAALYGAAQSLNALAPWRALWDTDILTLQLPGQEEPVFCSVMGRAVLSASPYVWIFAWFCCVSVYDGLDV